MKMKGLGLLLLVLLLSSCGADLTPQKEKDIQQYFDLESYFNQEATRLIELQPTVSKTIISKDRKETKELNTINWQNELALFRNNDINKPSWENKYTIDSTFSDDGSLVLTYTAKEEDLQTRQLDVELFDDRVHSIIIVNRVENAIYSSQQYLTYRPNREYTIKKTQDVTLMGDDDYEIEVSFIQ